MPGREAIDEHFLTRVRRLAPPTTGVAAAAAAGPGPTADELAALFEAQAHSRHLDLVARVLREQGDGFYTIASAGHESNAAVAMALRVDDPALLHYRSGAFYLARAAKRPGHDGVLDIARGLTGARTEPIAGGRHKVFGHPELAVIPQTSTVASHLPRAVGVAFAIERARKLGLPSPWPPDAVTVVSFGDASLNHSTAQGALGTAAWMAHQGLPLPLLLLCEDNGLGISVRSPAGWVAEALQARRQLAYFSARGEDPVQVWRASQAAVTFVRERRRPAVLHLRTVRFLGHAGSDAEIAYRSPAEIAADQERDPLLATARVLVETGALRPAQVLDRYERARRTVLSAAAQARGEPRLADRATVMEPIAPRRSMQVAQEVAQEVAQPAPPAGREQAFGGRLPEDEGPLTLAQSINRTLADLLVSRPETLVFGEDVAVKGGVYGVTRGLARTFGSARVFDTLLDEQAILGLALGTGLSGFLPIPEIQYLAYLHNAEDQLRGEAATLPFFAQGRYRNPMVVRVAAYGYQKGFGGHFHNDDAVAVLRDIPGIVVASPARPEDAAAMLRTCAQAAAVDGTVSVFLEPIALYHTRDLHQSGDDGWRAPYAAPHRWAQQHVPIGRARTHGDGRDLTIVTFGNGLRLSLRAARRLGEQDVAVRVLDLRWLVPLPVADLLRAAQATGRVLVADETRRSGGVSEAVVTALVDAGFDGRLARVTSADSFVPLGDAAELVLLSQEEIEQAALALLRR